MPKLEPLIIVKESPESGCSFLWEIHVTGTTAIIAGTIDYETCEKAERAAKRALKAFGIRETPL